MGVFGPRREAFLLLALVSSVASGLEPGSEECSELGFDGTLMCPTCVKLADALEDENDTLVGECRSCCSEPEVPAKYNRARLEVCK